MYGLLTEVNFIKINYRVNKKYWPKITSKLIIMQSLLENFLFTCRTLLFLCFSYLPIFHCFFRKIKSKLSSCRINFITLFNFWVFFGVVVVVVVYKCR